MQRSLLICLFIFISCAQSFMEETQDAIPISLKVSKNTTDTGIILNWSTQWDFVKFIILRGMDSNNIKPIHNNIIQDKWNDITSISGKEYFYQIHAFNNKGRMIGRSDVIEGYRSYQNFSQVTPPFSFKASNNEFFDKIALYWYGEPNTTYRLYKSNQKNSSLILLTETNSIEYTDTNVLPGKIYYYKLVSVGQDENNNVLEKFRDNLLIQGSTSDSPTGLLASKQDISILGGIKLQWNENPNTDYIKIYRADQKNTEYKLINDFVQSSFYIDKSLPKIKAENINGKYSYPQYSYKIKSVNNSKESDFSQSSDGWAVDPDDILPAPKFTLKLDKKNYPYKITLNWSPNIKIQKDQSYKIMSIKDNKTNIILNNTKDLSYTTENITFGTRIEYYAQVINTKIDSLLGEPSLISYLSSTPAPPKIITISTNARDHITNNINTNINTTVYWGNNNSESTVGMIKKYWTITSKTGFIKLAWKKSIETEMVNSYNIYRSKELKDNYIKIETINATEYKDFILQNNQGKYENSKYVYPKYYYKVSANFSGQESKLSEVEIGMAIDPKDILPIPNYLSIPFHWANGIGFREDIKKGKDSPKGIEQIVNTYVSANSLWLTWDQVINATDYQVKHSRGNEQKEWYIHQNINKETKLLLGNEVSSQSLTGLYVFSDFWGYSQENVSFEVAPINGKAGNLIGDQVGIWFTEPDTKPAHY